MPRFAPRHHQIEIRLEFVEKRQQLIVRLEAPMSLVAEGDNFREFRLLDRQMGMQVWLG